MKPGDLVRRADKDNRTFLFKDAEKYNEVVCEVFHGKLGLVLAVKHVMWSSEIGGDFALVLYEGTYGWILCGELTNVSDPEDPSAY